MNKLGCYIHGNIKHAFQQFASSLILIAQGVVGVVSLGFILPSWGYNFAMWLCIKECNKK